MHAIINIRFKLIRSPTSNDKSEWSVVSYGSIISYKLLSILFDGWPLEEVGVINDFLLVGVFLHRKKKIYISIFYCSDMLSKKYLIIAEKVS